MIGENISGESEYYCKRHKVVLLEKEVKECYCRDCDDMTVRKKEKVPT